MKVQQEKQIYDLIIIGAGPVGLYAAFLAGYFRLNVLCLESDEYIGGQATKLYPFKTVCDFPGYYAIAAIDLIHNLYKQANQFDNVKITTNVQIDSYTINDEQIISLFDSQGTSYLCRNVLLTVGLGAFEPIKLEPEKFVDNFNYDISNIHYVHNNKYDCTCKNVLVLGGGDSAVEYAYQIKQTYPNSCVNLVHRGEKLRAIVHTYEELIEIGVSVIFNTELSKVHNCRCEFLQGAQNINYDYDYMLVQFGLKSLGSQLHQWDAFVKNKMKFVVDEHYQTSVPNFYAAGSCCYNPDKIDMIATGISEATIAINYIYKKINGDSNQAPFYILKHN